MKNQIVILTGPPGAGKSTVGEILAKKIKNSAIVSSDSLRDLIKNGRARIGDSEWKRQLSLGARNACLIAKSFYEEGFNVFLDDVVCTNDRFDFYLKNLGDCNLKIFLLLPDKETVAKRDLERGEEAMKERAIYLHDKFSEFIKMEKRFIVIDSSKLTAGETADKIMARMKS